MFIHPHYFEMMYIWIHYCNPSNKTKHYN